MDRKTKNRTSMESHRRVKRRYQKSNLNPSGWARRDAEVVDNSCKCAAKEKQRNAWAHIKTQGVAPFVRLGTTVVSIPISKIMIG